MLCVAGVSAKSSFNNVFEVFVALDNISDYLQVLQLDVSLNPASFVSKFRDFLENFQIVKLRGQLFLVFWNRRIRNCCVDDSEQCCDCADTNLSFEFFLLVFNINLLFFFLICSLT